MAVLEMQRLTVCALKKDRKFILEKLQNLGVLEVDHVIGEDEDFKKMDTAGRRQGFEKAAASADQALEILERYAPEKRSMFAALEGKKLISPGEERRVREERRDLLKAAREIYDLDRERAEELSEITKLENSIGSLTPWLGLDVPMKNSGTRRTVMLVGTMPGGTTVESIYEVLAEKAPEIIGADIHVVLAEQSAVYLALICMKEDADAAEEAHFIDAWLGEYIKNDIAPVAQLRNVGVILLYNTEKGLNEWGKSISDIMGGDVYKNIVEIESLKEFCTRMNEILTKVTDYVTMLKSNTVSSTVQKCRRYILEHMDTPGLSLKHVADTLYLNESYLSRIFKQATGESVNRFLMRCRIEKSMELLNTTSLKAYEVGEKVGMPDAHYFGLAFKKYTGKTINEFRNLSRSQNHDI